MPWKGRVEKRANLAIPVYLAKEEGLWGAEKTLTENVSSHGSRVVTGQRWQAKEQLWFGPLTGAFQVRAHVVYCQPLDSGQFAVGLVFPRGPISWGYGAAGSMSVVAAH